MAFSKDVVTIYVCLTDGCGNYYGSSSMGNLEKQENIGAVGSGQAGQVTGHRNKCPTCGKPRVRRFARLVPQHEVLEAKQKVLSDLKQGRSPNKVISPINK